MPQLIATVQGVEVKHIHLNKPRTTLGRKSGNDIVLDNMVVSGEHCVFELEGLADVYLRDLGSTNGTYVNNQMAKQRIHLQDGDTIAIGPFRIRYLQHNEQPSTFGATTQFGAGDLQAPLLASFQVMSGTSAGLTVPVVKAVTTFGRPGVCVVSVSHRRNGYFVTHLSGDTKPMLNGNPVGTEEPTMLSDQDVLDLAGTKMLFQLEEAA